MKADWDNYCNSLHFMSPFKQECFFTRKGPSFNMDLETIAYLFAEYV